MRSAGPMKSAPLQELEPTSSAPPPGGVQALVAIELDST
jgi:hypothetical protein